MGDRDTGAGTADGPTIVRRLGGWWRGRQGMARCPAHKDRTPSLHLTQLPGGPLLVRCFGGCGGDQERTLDALRRAGLWPERTPHRETLRARPAAPVPPLPVPEAAPEPDEDRRRARARELWRVSWPARDTLAERYLHGRGLVWPVPPTIRFLDELRHPDTGRDHPCLVAAVQDGRGRVTAVQRIYLAPPGVKACGKRSKLALGVLGDGAVRLAPAGPVLGLAEGIETALAAMILFGLPVWATLGLGRLGAVAIPDPVERLVLFGDPGAAAAAAAERAATGYERQGLAVAVTLPGEQQGDWADVLVSPGRSTIPILDEG